MKHSIRQFSFGLSLFLVGMAGQGLAQSTPQQVEGSDWQLLTTTSPAVTTGGTNEFIAWMGLNNDVYFAEFNGTSWINHQIVGGPGWTAQTSAAPSLAFVYENDVWLAWKGLSDNNIWYSIWDGTSWSTQQVVSGSGWTAATNYAPSLVLFQNSVYLTWTGDGTAQDIWFTYQTGIGNQWGPQQTVSGPGWTAQASSAPSIETSETFEYGFIYLFWQEKSSNGIWETNGLTYPNSYLISWSDGQFQVGGLTDVAPAAVTLGSNLTVFYKESTSNVLSYFCAENSGNVSGSGWSAFTNVAPAVASSTDSILAWKNATDNTVWFMDPTTLPGTKYCGS
jgi:hypothetical protein